MKIERIIYPSGSIGTKINKDNSYKYISNGSVWTDCVVLGRTDRVENWHDTNEEPPEPEEQATDEDLENALTELGV